MNRLFRILHRWKCRTIAQKLALDALRQVSDDPRRPNLFLWNVDRYLRGVDAPEQEFRDYTNHVYYPETCWGGAPRLARKWYWRTVESLRNGDWSEAVYEAGVLVRYVTFVSVPCRTGHNERGLAYCRPIELSLTRLYDELVSRDAPRAEVTVPMGEDWLEQLIAERATDSQRHLSTVTEQYDIERMVTASFGLNDEIRAIFTSLLLDSAASLAAVLDRALQESHASPPRYPIGFAGLAAVPSLPVYWLTCVNSRAKLRKELATSQRQLLQAESLDDTLSASATAVRDAYELEVLRKPPRRESLTDQKPSIVNPTEKRNSASRLARESNDILRELAIGTTSSIDPKLITKLERLGITTADELLASDADQLASNLDPLATATDVVAWQDEFRLRRDIDQINAVEAQLLVACGVTGRDDLAALEPVELWELLASVAESPDGRRLLHGETPPDLAAITRWIHAARDARIAA